jgi:hypothetical protein
MDFRTNATEPFNDLNKLFFNFIWDGKPEKIKRNTLIADYDTFVISNEVVTFN